MRAESLNFPPGQGKAVHQVIDQLLGVGVRILGEVGIFGGGQDAVVAEDLLYFEQIDTRLDQMCGITVAKRMRGDLFFNPH